jgi:predicted DNA repair protein MutK
MAGSSLLSLLDDITTLLDDVATMSKLALKKTAGVVGDDLALNAQQLVGIHVDRELPVVWKVARGSLINKAILVPVALLIGGLLPQIVVPLLMAGGAFLCYEGFEKIVHKWLHSSQEDPAHRRHHADAIRDDHVDLVELESTRIQGAIRTDFILSAEIIVISLGMVADRPFQTQVAVLVTIALLMTVGVYGLVALVIKLDDIGRYLSLLPGHSFRSRCLAASGRAILVTAPYLMRGISIAGTVAMFMVGGGILTHGVSALHHGIEALAEIAGSIAWVGDLLAWLTAASLQALAGLAAGAIAVGAVTLVRRLRGGASH